MAISSVLLMNLTPDKEREIMCWARDNCPSFGAWYVYEDSINNIDTDEWNTEFRFTFSDERDALMFQLRWQGQVNE
jgi:hypothetical protein